MIGLSSWLYSQPTSPGKVPWGELSARVLAACDQLGTVTTRNVMSATGCTRMSGRSALSRLTKSGVLERCGRGQYRRAEQ